MRCAAVAVQFKGNTAYAEKRSLTLANMLSGWCIELSLAYDVWRC